MFLFVYAGLGSFEGFRAFGFSGALVAQNCSKSPRARSGPLRAARNRSERAQSRSEPRRIAQSGRSELLKAPLQIAQSAPRAAQSPSDSPRAVAQSRSEPLRIAQSCSRNRSVSSVSRALCISDAQSCLTWFSLLRACICTGSH